MDDANDRSTLVALQFSVLSSDCEDNAATAIDSSRFVRQYREGAIKFPHALT
jgi:hypothetical protein